LREGVLGSVLALGVLSCIVIIHYYLFFVKDFF